MDFEVKVEAEAKAEAKVEVEVEADPSTLREPQGDNTEVEAKVEIDS